MKQKHNKPSDLEKLKIDPETDKKLDDMMEVFKSDEWKKLEDDIKNLKFDPDFDKHFEDFDFDMNF